MLSLNKKKSVLFLHPDYHYTFTMSEELTRRGWATKIWVPVDYPKQLLFSERGISQVNTKLFKYLPVNRYKVVLEQAVWYLKEFWTYEFHVYYGRLIKFPIFEKKMKNKEVYKLRRGDSTSHLVAAKRRINWQG